MFGRTLNTPIVPTPLNLGRDEGWVILENFQTGGGGGVEKLTF